MSEKLEKLRAMLEKEKERRIKLNNRIEILEPKHILSGAAGCCFQSSVAPVLYITTRLFLITHRR